MKFNNDFIDLSISGVYRNFPSTSTLNPDFIADIKLSERMYRLFQKFLGDYGNEGSTNLNWANGDFISFVMLDKNANRENLSLKMEKYKKLINNESIKDASFSFQPVSDIYLKSGDLGGRGYMREGDANELKYYEAISLLILDNFNYQLCSSHESRYCRQASRTWYQEGFWCLTELSEKTDYSGGKPGGNTQPYPIIVCL